MDHIRTLQVYYAENKYQNDYIAAKTGHVDELKDFIGCFIIKPGQASRLCFKLLRADGSAEKVGDSTDLIAYMLRMD